MSLKNLDKITEVASSNSEDESTESSDDGINSSQNDSDSSNPSSDSESSSEEEEYQNASIQNKTTNDSDSDSDSDSDASSHLSYDVKNLNNKKTLNDSANYTYESKPENEEGQDNLPDDSSAYEEIKQLDKNITKFSDLKLESNGANEVIDDDQTHSTVFELNPDRFRKMRLYKNRKAKSLLKQKKATSLNSSTNSLNDSLSTNNSNNNNNNNLALNEKKKKKPLKQQIKNSKGQQSQQDLSNKKEKKINHSITSLRDPSVLQGILKKEGTYKDKEEDINRQRKNTINFSLINLKSASSTRTKQIVVSTEELNEDLSTERCKNSAKVRRSSSTLTLRKSAGSDYEDLLNRQIKNSMTNLKRSIKNDLAKNNIISSSSSINQSSKQAPKAPMSSMSQAEAVKQQQLDQAQIEAKIRAEQLKYRSTVTVDTSKARSNAEVLRMCIAELGWQECPSGLSSGCDIIWQSCASHENRDQNAHNLSSCATSRLNKFPSMNQLLRKGPLTHSLNVMRSFYKEEYDFYPRTWFLPEQFKEFSQECRYMHDQELKTNQVLTTFIVKPNDGSQGDGIYLIKYPEDYLNTVPVAEVPARNQSKSYIVQEYIHNPFLIDGLKSDFRIYVVILNLKPLEIYMCDEGLVRFATVDYQTPNESNLNQIYMHLTNYSLNKKNVDSYKFTSNMSDDGQCDDSDENGNCAHESAGHGSKRKLTKIFSYMQKKGINVNRIKAAIDDLVIKTIFALLPEMKVESSFEIFNSPNKQRPASFQIIGFDILLNSNLKPILLEVNCNPSLRIDYESELPDGRTIIMPSPIDIDIKKPLVLETLKLAIPKKKLELIEKLRREEEQMEKAAKVRSYLVKQRMEQRIISAKLVQKFNFEKFPLLSKPGELYKKKLKLNSGTPSTVANSAVKQPPNNNSASPSTVYNHFGPTSNNTSSYSYYNNNYNSNNNSQSSSLTNLNSTSKLSLAKSNSEFDFKSPSQIINQSFSSRSCLRNIYSAQMNKPQYNHLFVQENIADLFIFFTLYNGTKLMSHSDFRLFVRKCNLISKKLSADNLDVIFFDLSKKWEMYNRKKIDYNTGLCYQGFVECFTKLSRIIFDEATLDQSLKSLLYYCKILLKRDGIKTSPLFNVEPTAQLMPLSQKLLNELGKLKLTNYLNDSTVQSEPSISLNLKPPALNPLINHLEVSMNDLTAASTATLKCKQIIQASKKATKKSIFPIFFDTAV